MTATPQEPQPLSPARGANLSICLSHHSQRLRNSFRECPLLLLSREAEHGTHKPFRYLHLHLIQALAGEKSTVWGLYLCKNALPLLILGSTVLLLIH
ncbi:hypothetical protein AGABI1DRAFT_81887 [Agaricus bisporus var. burnettii JB137-S8]|uniref:Uncharacterized protein n=1 Tax=Agaricus bisporus var. burnettii (strain JB137-S8 / ATCC MYA-4627 / FGSC 10392) TaxID=597362 RepID=K5WBC8_AGABU|nr:uncharacterized protein AGABI1DRAFT_81887 [Agaricus bisporus var. burnettii JB137-S8]EKM84189.1 hypothetical protein AGABI1DRAFT_81887 [Agaricus bisporus var. burnettii JB137-S8]